MATQEVKTNQGQEKREPQKAGMVRRGYGTLEFLPTPADLFLMNPFSLMRRVTEEMNRAFGQATAGPGNGTAWVPAIEVAERDGKFVVRAELAGLTPENVKVTAAEDSLILEGERKYEHEEDQGGVHRTERRYGKFYRSIPLPEGVNLEQAHAKFENGVLEITMPMAEQSAGIKEIPIESSLKTGAGVTPKAA
jgi:HSP20 family protein